MPQAARADLKGAMTITLLRDAVITNTQLDLGHENRTAYRSSGRNPKKETSAGKFVYGRYALRNHLRARLRQKPGCQ